MKRWALALALALCGTPGAADDRRSGAHYMSPALQAMQRDEAQNPGQLWVREGEALGQRDCAGACHGTDRLRSAPARHPAFDAASGRALTLAGRIDACRVRHLQRPPQGPDGAEVLALSAWLAQLASGRPVASPADPRLQRWLTLGANLWRTRLGQLNLACTQCHDERAGLRLGGAAIPQGHPTGYPTYRLEWQTLGSLQRRLRGCVTGVRAEPYETDADEWVGLELYLMQRAAGMPLEGIAVRP